MVKKVFKVFTTGIVAAFLAVLSKTAIDMIAQILGYADAVSGFMTAHAWLAAMLLIVMFGCWFAVILGDKADRREK